MWKLHSFNKDTSTETRIATNSLVIVNWDFVGTTAGFATKAWVGATIIGISNSNGTYAADNQTVAKAEVNYLLPNETVRYKIAADAAIAQANVWSYFDLNANQTVDVATASATTGQVQLIELVGQTDSIYSIANK